MKLKRFGLIGLAIASAITAAIPVGAVPYENSNVYRAQERGQSYLYVSASSGTEVTVSMPGSSTSARLANACGIIALSQPTAGWSGPIRVGSQTITPASLPTQLLPGCSDGQLAEARPNHFRDTNGRVYLVGFTAGSSHAVTIARPVTRRSTANACGFARISFGDTTPQTVQVGGTSYNVMTLPNAGAGPICRTGEAYVPADWLGSSGGS